MAKKDNKVIGSTGIPMLMGTSSFGGEWEFWNQYWNESAGPTGDQLELGNRLEEAIIKWSMGTMDEDWYGLFGIREQARKYLEVAMCVLTGEEDGFYTRSLSVNGVTIPQRDSPDFEVHLRHGEDYRPVASGEAKCLVYSGRHGMYSDGTPHFAGAFPDDFCPEQTRQSTIPRGYYDQCQYHMDFAETHVCFVPVLFNFTSKPVRFIVFRDQDRIDLQRVTVAKFWRDHIIANKPPKQDESEGMWEHLRAIQLTDEKYIEGGTEHIALVKRFMDATDAYKDAAAAKQDAKNRLHESIGEYWGIQFPGGGRINCKMNHRGHRVLNINPKIKKQILTGNSAELLIKPTGDKDEQQPEKN